MKKQLLFTLLLSVIANVSFASFNQGNWRWRNNNGNETTATWKAAQNTSIEVVSASEVLRLRVEIGIATDSNNASYTFSVDYSSDGTKWKSLSTDGSINAFVIAVSNNFLMKNEATTQQLSTSSFDSYTLVPGSIIIDQSITSYDISKTTEQVCEYEIVLVPTVNTEAGKTYYFRLGSFDVSYPVDIPTLTTATTLPIILKSLKAKSSINGITIYWSTASEINNSFFSLQRSANGLDWIDIAKIAGNGTTNSESTYSYLDAQPLRGTNYYRLAQHDSDGKINYSGVTSAKFDFATTEASVYPNPFTDQINISLSGYSGKSFSTRLTNTQGQVVFQENLIANDAGVSIKLNQVQKSGIYILSVNGNGLNLVKKVSAK